MGRTPKPLKILVHPELWEANRETLQAYRDQGHTVDIMDAWVDEGEDTGTYIAPRLTLYDIIFGRNCWNMLDLTFLDIALKGARAIRYPPGEKKPRKKSGKAKKATKKDKDTG